MDRMDSSSQWVDARLDDLSGGGSNSSWASGENWASAQSTQRGGEQTLDERGLLESHSSLHYGDGDHGPHADHQVAANQHQMPCFLTTAVLPGVIVGQQPMTCPIPNLVHDSTSHSWAELIQSPMSSSVQVNLQTAAVAPSPANPVMEILSLRGSILAKAVQIRTLMGIDHTTLLLNDSLVEQLDHANKVAALNRHVAMLDTIIRDAHKSKSPPQQAQQVPTGGGALRDAHKYLTPDVPTTGPPYSPPIRPSSDSACAPPKKKRKITNPVRSQTYVAIPDFRKLTADDKRFSLPRSVSMRGSKTMKNKTPCSAGEVFSWCVNYIRHLSELARDGRLHTVYFFSDRSLEGKFRTANPDVTIPSRLIGRRTHKDESRDRMRGFSVTDVVQAAQKEWPDLVTSDFIDSIVNKRTLVAGTGGGDGDAARAPVDESLPSSGAAADASGGAGGGGGGGGGAADDGQASPPPPPPDAGAGGDVGAADDNQARVQARALSPPTAHSHSLTLRISQCSNYKILYY
jgi:hypothetical protein